MCLCVYMYVIIYNCVCTYVSYLDKLACEELENSSLFYDVFPPCVFSDI